MKVWVIKGYSGLHGICSDRQTAIDEVLAWTQSMGWFLTEVEHHEVALIPHSFFAFKNGHYNETVTIQEYKVLSEPQNWVFPKKDDSP